MLVSTVVLLQLVLCSLMCRGAAQLGVCGGLEDFRYPFTWSDPQGCTSSTAGSCKYFVGIQPNKDNSSHLDFHLEGSAPGWVAIGFSAGDTASMVSELRCIACQHAALVIILCCLLLS